MSTKKTKWYQYNSEIVETVRYCLQFRLSEKETCKKLSELGHDISTRTIRRIKKKLIVPQRLDEIVEVESSSFVIESLDNIEDVKQKAKKVYDESQSPYVKLRALGMILKSVKHKAEFYDSANLIALLGRKIHDNHDALEKD